MPATAGRVRMPANNRVHSSAALQTHGIWQSAIGYDPYAPTTDTRNKSKPESDNSAANAYNSFQDLLALARVTSASDPARTRGACKKCGRIGHLTYQCRNFLSLKNADDDDVIKPPPPRQQNYDPAPRIEEIEESAGDDDESLSSDSDSDSDSSVDPEIEKIIAERFGKKMSTKVGSLSVRSGKRSNSSNDDDDEVKRKERKHGHGRRNHHRRRRRRRDSDSETQTQEEKRFRFRF